MGNLETSSDGIVDIPCNAGRVKIVGGNLNQIDWNLLLRAFCQADLVYKDVDKSNDTFVFVLRTPSLPLESSLVDALNRFLRLFASKHPGMEVVVERRSELED